MKYRENRMSSSIWNDPTRRTYIWFVLAIAILTTTYFSLFLIMPQIIQIKNDVISGKQIVMVEPDFEKNVTGLGMAALFAFFISLALSVKREIFLKIVLFALAGSIWIFFQLFLTNISLLESKYASEVGYERCQIRDQFRYMAHGKSRSYPAMAEAWARPGECKPAS